MAKRNLNGYASWSIVLLAVLALAFNTGVTYNHIQELSVKVDKLSEDVGKLAFLMLAAREKIDRDNAGTMR